MAIPNLLLNVNYKEACGQSSVLQHLLSYSHKIGVFPQHLNNISSNVNCIWRNNESIVNLLYLHNDFYNIAKQDDYLYQLERILALDCKDIERKPILESNFNFCLPTSADAGNLMTANPDQCMYFAYQTGPLYVYDYNKRFKRENVVIVNEKMLYELNQRYKLNAKTFNEILTQLGEKISNRKPIQAANFIKDKPIVICDIALEHGLDYVIEEGIDIFTKDFLSIKSPTDNFTEMKNVLNVEVNELSTSLSSATDYYKYLCDSLNISVNIELFNNFHNTFVNADTRNRLKTITKSDFLTDILCNETNTN